MTCALVRLSLDVYLVCTNHALTTEREEVMGLLLGDVESTPQGNITTIVDCMVLQRSDKRKDRVEISPEQLTGAAAEAERLSTQLGKRVRVIGWYHSHPHITVHPSHVDVRTQASYQLMDSDFVGLIFSVFNENQGYSREGTVEVIAFQSIDMDAFAAEQAAAATPSASSPTTSNAASGQQDAADFRHVKGAFDLPVGPFAKLSLTVDATMQKTYVGSGGGSSSSSRKGFMTQSQLMLDTALQQSAASQGWQQRNIPLQLIRTSPSAPNTLSRAVHLQSILQQEERNAYLSAVQPKESGDSRPIHPLTLLNSSAVYQKALCHLMEYGCAPLLQMLEDVETHNQKRISALEAQIASAKKS